MQIGAVRLSSVVMVAAVTAAGNYVELVGKLRCLCDVAEDVDQPMELRAAA